MKKQGKWFLIFLVVMVLVSGSTSGAAKDLNGPGKIRQSVENGKPIKIGYLLPLTGRASSYGLMQKIAVDMAVEEINKQGGVNGSPIKLLIGDDQFDPQQSVLLFRKLAGENVFAVIGPYSGGCWQNVAPIANQMKVPALCLTAVKPGVAMLPWAFRMAVPDDINIPNGVKKFKELFPNIKKVIVIGDVKEASSAAAIKEFKKVAVAEGLELLDTIGYQTGTTDFSPEITKLKALKPDAVFIATLTNEALGVAKEIKRQDIKVPILGNAMIWAGAFPTASGDAGENWYSIGYFNNEPDPSNQKAVDFVKKYLERSKTNQQIQQPANITSNSLAYEAVYILADIFKTANIDGNTPVKEARTKIQQKLVAIKDYKGVINFRIRPNGDGIAPVNVYKLDVQKKYWVRKK